MILTKLHEKPELRFKARLTAVETLTCSGIRDWLKASGRYQYLINIYSNPHSGIVVVLSDRNTAILIKLALG